MQLNSVTSVTTNSISNTTHQHRLGDCIMDSETGKQFDKDGTGVAKDALELSTQQVLEAQQTIEETNLNMISQAISNGKEALLKFWGPSKAELEAGSRGEEGIGNLEKLSPYQVENKALSLPRKLVTRAKVKIVNLATGLFQFMSGKKQFEARQEEQKREKPKHVVVENVHVDISSEGMAQSSHLLDSYDKSGAYSSIGSQARKH